MSQLYDVPVEATVDGIKFHYEDGEVEVDYNASNDDVVRLTIEPLEVKVTDGFRAAVKEACKCDSSSGGDSGGSTGGGVLVVHETVSGYTHSLDKNYNEIVEAMEGGGAILEITNTLFGQTERCFISQADDIADTMYSVVAIYVNPSNQISYYKYTSDSATGVLSYGGAE